MTAVDSRARASRLALPAIFAALIAAGAFISLPLPGSPVPMVLQNLLVVLAGILLGPLRGALAVLAFLLLGLLGFPVFSGGHGGFAWFAGPTGGFLVGYLAAALLAGFLGKTRRPIPTILGSVLSFALILCMGVVWLKISRNLPWPKALAAGLVPFLVGDGIKAALVVILSLRLGSFFDSLNAEKIRKGD